MVSIVAIATAIAIAIESIVATTTTIATIGFPFAISRLLHVGHHF
jgi:hypothetical protein